MRIRIFDAVLLFVLCILLIGVCAICIGIGFGWITPEFIAKMASYIDGYWLNTLFMVGGSVIVLLIVLWLLISVFVMRKPSAPSGVEISRTEYGVVTITNQTLVDLSINAIRKNTAVKELRCSVIPHSEGGIVVRASIAFAHDAQIALEAETIQHTVQEELSAITSLTVVGVVITVDNSLVKSANRNAKNSKELY